MSNPYQVLTGDALSVLRTMPSESVNCIVTSPPYWGLRDYGHDGQIGLEATPQEFVSKMTEIFQECRRVLTADGVCWVNIGDSYASDMKGSGGPSEKQLSNNGSRYQSRKLEHGLKPKDLVGIPWRVAFALQDDGWYLRSDIIWAKPNPMPESVRDRPTKAHEYIFLLTKSAKYSYDADAIKEAAIHEGRVVKATGADAKNGQKGKFGATAAGFTTHDTIVTNRNARTVWSISTQGYPGAHFATFPEELPRRCILAGCPEGGTVLDPFAGSGTTLAVAVALGRKAIGIELNPEYVELIHERMRGVTPSLFGGVE